MVKCLFLSVILLFISAINANSSGTCFLSSYQLPPSDQKSVGHPSQFFGQNDAQQKINVIPNPPPQTKGGSSGGSSLRGFESSTSGTTPATPSTFPPPRRVNYFRPASRTGGTRPIQAPPSPPYQTLQPQFVNAEELETIALFEAALERAQKDFGSRINNIDSMSQFSGQSLHGRSPLPKSPPRRRPQQQFTPPINHGTNFFQLDFNDFSQDRITTVDQDYDFSRKTSQRRVEQSRIELPPSTAPPTRPPTTTTTPRPYPINRGKTSEQTFTQQREVTSNRGIKEASFSSFDSRSVIGRNQPATTRFMAWLEKAKMLRNMQIAPGVNFTVLLPSDSAIQSLPATFTNELGSNMTKLREILFYHIIPLSIEMINLQDGQTLPTLYSKSIRVTRSINDPIVSMSGSRILNERADMALSGGKVRFFDVDKVLFPPRGSLYSIISTTPDLSIFGRLLDETDLRSELAFNGPFTMFAPSNGAFNKLDSEAMTFLTSDPKNAKDFVLRHISKPVVFAASIPTSSSVPVETAFGEKINVVRIADDLVQVDGVAVTFADIFATNGVLHVLDQVL